MPVAIAGVDRCETLITVPVGAVARNGNSGLKGDAMAQKRSAEVLPAAHAKIVRSRNLTVREGYLPVNEICFDRPGAASPFGDDILFPMPISELTYVHPTADAPPAHL